MSHLSQLCTHVATWVHAETLCGAPDYNSMDEWGEGHAGERYRWQRAIRTDEPTYSGHPGAFLVVVGPPSPASSD
eukprot:493808-Prymnesium_polylepis.1